MKKLSIILLSALMLMGMVQCKKNKDIANSANEILTGETVYMILKVSDNGSKLSVNPNTGQVGFTSGDVMYVAYNGVYAGKLIHDGTDFVGGIMPSGASGQKFSYYFLGNKTPDASLLPMSTTSISVSIFDQTDNYPVISAGVSNETYPAAGGVYTATLNNKCALVKFNINTASQYAPTVIVGANDKVQVSFSAGNVGTFTNSKERGAVKLASGSGERWAIMLPQEASGVEKAYSEDLRFTGNHGPIPTVMDNGYLTNGINVTVGNAIQGFSCDDSHYYYFAPGNLQATYNGSNWSWAFAKNQYDFVGNNTANNKINGSMSVSSNGTVDLFGWNGASSAYNNYGINNSTTNADYGNVAGESLKSDWGNNTITNGYGMTWFTPTNNNWGYVLFDRPISSGVRYAKAQVGGINGLIIVPDDWETSYYALASTNVDDADYTDNEISLVDWTARLEANGAVFLPAAGYRDGATVSNAGLHGAYYSSTSHEQPEHANAAYYLYFTNTNYLNTTYFNRCSAYSVRLICKQ